MGTSKNGETKTPWPIRKAYSLSLLIFISLCVLLLNLVVAILYGAIEKVMAFPRANATMWLAAGIFFIGVGCALIGVLLSSFISALLFRTKVQRAVPLPLIMNWYDLSGPHAVVQFIREKNLDVYISKTQSRQEVENLTCGMLPLYTLPVFFNDIRAMLRAFNEIYFDRQQLDSALDKELLGIHNAAPEKLLAYASFEQRTIAEAVRSELKEKGNRGYAGRLAALMKRNHFLTVHTVMVVKLTLHFSERWAKRKSRTEPIISHASIQKAESAIRDADPVLTDLLMEKCAKKNPDLPSSMRDMFRYAMPDEMVQWPGGKSTLQDLVKKHLKDAGLDDQREAPHKDGRQVP